MNFGEQFSETPINKGKWGNTLWCLMNFDEQILDP